MIESKSLLDGLVELERRACSQHLDDTARMARLARLDVILKLMLAAPETGSSEAAPTRRPRKSAAAAGDAVVLRTSKLRGRA